MSWTGRKRLIVVEGVMNATTGVDDNGDPIVVQVPYRRLHPDCPVFGKVVAGPFTEQSDIDHVQQAVDRWNNIQRTKMTGK
tara:strand:- start:87 stop:329 length:243 start_codon:yes stop_codon:yes gene_type:complete